MAMQPEPVPRSTTRSTRAGSIHGAKPAGDQLGERRARHDHSLVDFELESGEPHPAHQVGDGHAAAQPLGEQAEYLLDLRPARLDRIRGPGVGMVEPERMEDERRSVIPRIHRAVPVGEPGGVEFPRAKTDQLRDGGRGWRLAGERVRGRRHGRCGPMG